MSSDKSSLSNHCGMALEGIEHVHAFRCLCYDHHHKTAITIKPMDTPEQREQLAKEVAEAIRGKNAKRDSN